MWNLINSFETFHLAFCVNCSVCVFWFSPLRCIFLLFCFWPCPPTPWGLRASRRRLHPRQVLLQGSLQYQSTIDYSKEPIDVNINDSPHPRKSANHVVPVTAQRVHPSSIIFPVPKPPCRVAQLSPLLGHAVVLGRVPVHALAHGLGHPHRLRPECAPCKGSFENLMPLVYFPLHFHHAFCVSVFLPKPTPLMWDFIVFTL